MLRTLVVMSLALALGACTASTDGGGGGIKSNTNGIPFELNDHEYEGGTCTDVAQTEPVPEGFEESRWNVFGLNIPLNSDETAAGEINEVAYRNDAGLVDLFFTLQGATEAGVFDASLTYSVDTMVWTVHRGGSSAAAGQMMLIHNRENYLAGVRGDLHAFDAAVFLFAPTDQSPGTPIADEEQYRRVECEQVTELDPEEFEQGVCYWIDGRATSYCF